MIWPATNVTRRYGPTAVVEGVSLTLEPGNITALLGGSGAGKSTLLRLFAGLEPLDGGEIRLGDELLSAPGKTVPAEKRRIGLIFQDFALFPHLTAAQNVAFGLKSRGKEAARLLAAEWLERLGLTDRAGAYPHELSGGEQQRVAVARAIAKRPALLFCDEPTGALDSKTGIQVLEALDHVNSELGATTVVITHNVGISEMSDRTIRLSDGRIVDVEEVGRAKKPTDLSW